MIRIAHNAEPTHVQSIAVKEEFGGVTIWNGIVEVFDLVGHPMTNRVYAWAHDTEDPLKPRRHVTVLHIGPVTSALKAVRAAIMQEFKSRDAGEEA